MATFCGQQWQGRNRRATGPPTRPGLCPRPTLSLPFGIQGVALRPRLGAVGEAGDRGERGQQRGPSATAVGRGRWAGGAAGWEGSSGLPCPRGRPQGRRDTNPRPPAPRPHLHTDT